MTAELQHQDDGNVTSGRHLSYWLDSTEPIVYTPLEQDIIVDVAIVGGGLSGLSCAYELTKRNLKVAVLEDGYIGSGETGRTTAHLVNALDDRYYDIEKKFNEEVAKLAAASHTAAIDYIERTVQQENIACDFERLDGYLFLHPTDEESTLRKELDATQRAAIPTEWVAKMPGIKSDMQAIRFPRQAQFHVMKYLQGLCKAIVAKGGQIFTNTHVKSVKKEHAETANGKKVTAKHFIVATNTPVNDLVTMHTKQAPYRTYAIGAAIAKDSIKRALWWDTGDHESKWPTYPYHYARLQPYNETHDLLIVGGEDHKTGQADEEQISEEQRYRNLQAWTQRHFPSMENVVYRWSGQVMEPADNLGYIGRNPGDNNIYIVTGDSGNGMTHATIAAMLISDLIQEIENPWVKIYDPSRSAIHGAREFLEENLNVAKKYTELLTSGDNITPAKLKNGEGAIIRSGLSKKAIYKDERGHLHTFSAVCPHLGCIVHWNPDEKSFDCPCHGSRFTCFGKVVNGPANTDLETFKQ
ncbi:MAG: FAD-dependent oxidoreductase [Chitinophagales bacterium]|nr:FAD-dependent oxidoreductase [Chitinophagales bacterium]